ncbi:DUF418 domain-containing protein [Burkholderiaceae bacterium UC74_6]
MGAAIDAEPLQAPPEEPPAPLVPVAASQRIEALDVVRGFALLGIFLMNIEWFNRPFAAFNEGMPHGMSGADWLASWFIGYFVQGKFWTIFSLLFGMGFALMLVRAERAGRKFVSVYLRRILALAVFGAAHYIFLWDGDILFSYAVGALALLILLYGRARRILIACAVLVAGAVLISVVFEPDAAEYLFTILGGLGATGLLALFLRGEKQLRWGRVGGLSVPLFSFILLAFGLVMSIGAVVLWWLPHSPMEARMALSVFGPLLFIFGSLSWKYHQPAEQRALRMAVSLYVFASLAVTSAGVVQYLAPDPTVVPASVPQAEAEAATAEAAKGEKAKGEKPKKKTPQERAAEAKAERDKNLKEQADRKVEELKVSKGSSYADLMLWRARQFPEKAAGDAGFAVLLLGMFLLGAWFVRSGVMENSAAHLPLFRKFAVYGLPVGIGIGLLGSFIATSHTPGDRYDGWMIARGLLFLGNLPACLGYVGLVVTMLHSRGLGSRIRVLAPLGRMALTNYLMQSLICASVFYGYGLGQWGLPRAKQVLFVAVVYAGQVAFSHWWLARFRYGPMEWLWRGFTYRETPPMRVEATAAVA